MERETGSDETEWRAKPQGGCAQVSHPHGGREGREGEETSGESEEKELDEVEAELHLLHRQTLADVPKIEPEQQ